MAINATYNGKTYNNVTELKATDGSTESVVTLAETGVIDTPTATKETTIEANGTVEIDVTTYKTIKITTNVSGGSTKTLESISAVANTTSYPVGTSASDLDVTVTGTYSDGSTAIITGWAVADTTIAKGTNEIAIEYNGLTCTVTVTGTEAPDGYVTDGLIAMWDAESEQNTASTLKDLIGSLDIPLSSYGSITDGWLSVTGGIGVSHKLSLTDCTLETLIQPADSSTGIIIEVSGDDVGKSVSTILYSDGSIGGTGTSGITYSLGSIANTAVRSTSVTASSYADDSMMINGASLSRGSATHSYRPTATNKVCIGATSVAGNSGVYTGKIKCIRLYDRKLTDSERLKNYNYDAYRLG